jgi:hypothetical protein
LSRSVKGFGAQDGGAPATELVAGRGRGSDVCGRAPNGEGGDYRAREEGNIDQIFLNLNP